ncbi:hypothetical protein N9188_00635, partial [bacterium]|nr:hypothetical protein [bacterium]
MRYRAWSRCLEGKWRRASLCQVRLSSPQRWRPLGAMFSGARWLSARWAAGGAGLDPPDAGPRIPMAEPPVSFLGSGGV